MNMITFTARDRDKIIRLHTDLANAIEQENAVEADRVLQTLASETNVMADTVFTARAGR